MKTVHIVIVMEPIAKARPRLGKYGVFTPTRTRKAEAFLKLHFNKYSPSDKPCSVDITFGCSHKNKSLWQAPKPTRPDLDNLVKTVLDAANGCLFFDDSQVFSLTARKVYAETGKIEITLTFDE